MAWVRNQHHRWCQQSSTFKTHQLKSQFLKKTMQHHQNHGLPANFHLRTKKHTVPNRGDFQPLELPTSWSGISESGPEEAGFLKVRSSSRVCPHYSHGTWKCSQKEKEKHLSTNHQFSVFHVCLRGSVPSVRQRFVKLNSLLQRFFEATKKPLSQDSISTSTIKKFLGPCLPIKTANKNFQKRNLWQKTSRDELSCDHQVKIWTFALKTQNLKPKKTWS